MEDQDLHTTETLIVQLGGCGLFQWCLSGVLYSAYVPAVMTLMFMSFGNYNPGWRCNDNVTSLPIWNNDTGVLAELNNDTDDTSIMSPLNTSKEPEGYHFDSCRGFDSCENVSFHPEASTIVTEWGLACGSGWILSTMTSVQMAGTLLGTLVCGYLGDKFGRLLPFQIGMGVSAVLTLLTMFSVSWQMFTALSFVTGIFNSFFVLVEVIMMEFVPDNWRVRVYSFPSWGLSGVVLGVVAMATTDWKLLKLINSLLFGVSFFALFWAPESLRYLLARGEIDKSLKVTRKIAKYNKSDEIDKDSLSHFQNEKSENDKKSQTSSILQLFRKNYRIPAIVYGFITSSIDLCYFAFSFGISAMPGNLYINIIIFSLSDLPANLISFSLANKFNRKPTICVFFLGAALAVFAVVALDQCTTGNIKTIGVLVCVLVAKVCLYVAWVVESTSLIEFYPTVARSSARSYSGLASQIGMVIAPYLIPSDPQTFYLCYLAMGVLNFVCAASVILLPETKRKPLIGTWEDDERWMRGEEMDSVVVNVNEDSIAGEKPPIS